MVKKGQRRIPTHGELEGGEPKGCSARLAMTSIKNVLSLILHIDSRSSGLWFNFLINRRLHEATVVVERTYQIFDQNESQLLPSQVHLVA